MITLTPKQSSFLVSTAAFVAAVAVGVLFPVAAIGLYVSGFLLLMGRHDYRRGAAAQRVARQVYGDARSPLRLAA